jgi:peptidoglycan/LPS O-acetylase OafA/YrhL
MLTYAGFLVLCGLLAFALSGFDWTHGKTALVVPLGCAVIMAICAHFANKVHTNRAAGTIGIHAGLLFPLLFAVLVGWRAWKAYEKLDGPEGKGYLAAILAVIAIGSVVAFVAILKTRPPKEARG